MPNSALLVLVAFFLIYIAATGKTGCVTRALRQVAGLPEGAPAPGSSEAKTRADGIQRGESIGADIPPEALRRIEAIRQMINRIGGLFGK